MSPLILHHRETEPALSVPLWFIQEYMPEANGDFVKVYLFLQLISLQADAALSIADIADRLSCTESDVVRALRYWDRKGLIVLTLGEDDIPTEIAFLSPKSTASTVSTQKPQPALPAKDPAPARSRAPRKPQPVSVQTDEEFQELRKVIERYLGRTLTSREVQMAEAWYHHTDGNKDLIDYLVEYCVGVKDPECPSFEYMDAVLVNWQNDGITTAAQARSETRISREEATAYLRAMGSDRKRLPTEQREYLARAKRGYGMPFEQILYAATLTARAGAGVAYFTAIVDNWNKAGIRSLEAAKKDREDHKAASAAKARQERAAASSAPRRTSFHNFEQRESAGGDWSELDTYRPDEDPADGDAEKEQEEWEALLASFRTSGRKKKA